VSTSTQQTNTPFGIGDIRDIGFAIGIIFMLAVLFLPLPPLLVDVGLAVSFALSILILMVALWIQRPLDFSAFPTILLIATMLRLAMNIATTRLILTNGAEGPAAAGHVISGFSTFVMAGDFVIGVVIFLILLTVNFVVITKGATRIAEVGARFALDAVPGKQMAIDADLSAGIIGEREAQMRRRELEEESAFFGSMDGASKFVRGDAIAGLIITAVNIIGGIAIGVLRYDLPLVQAVETFTKLSVGDGLVSQIPALVISLAAGLVVAKGGTRGSAESAVLGQLGAHPRALMVTAGMLSMLALVPGLPFVPFAILAAATAAVGFIIPRRRAAEEAERQEREQLEKREAEEVAQNSVQNSLNVSDIEIGLGRRLSVSIMGRQDELKQRVSKMRRKFARHYGFVIPDISISTNSTIEAQNYQICIHGTVVSSHALPPASVLVIVGDGPECPFPGEETTEPAFGMKAMWVPESLANEVTAKGFTPIDPMTVMLTHLSEVLRNNLAQLLSYRDLQQVINNLQPEYHKLLEEIVPGHISLSGIQAVLKSLLAERVSIRSLGQILEAIAEIAPHVQRTDHVVEHVRRRMAAQICGDIAADLELCILRLGNRWDLAFHEAIQRSPNGEIVDFMMDPKVLEEFTVAYAAKTKELLEGGTRFAVVASAEARPYVRMITERVPPSIPVLSHVEISKSTSVRVVGSIS
jgi:flagellar biosynthesis protein FlhA